jgi:signal transduction histidine kinase
VTRAWGLGFALLACAWLSGPPVATSAVSVLPTPTISLPVPFATPSLPALASSPVPTLGTLLSPGVGLGGASPSIAAGQGGGVGGSTATAPAPAATGSVIDTVIRLLASQIPVLPVLLPVLAGLLLLLASAVLAAYRRTQDARRLARLERTKSDFLRLASHELRTPLTVLLGYVSMIRDGDVKPDTPAFKKALSIIQDRLNQVNTVVEQMLEAARLEEGPDPLEIEEFDIGALVTKSVASARGRGGSANPVGYGGPPGPLLLRSDPRRVATIVDQLLDNALKYSPEGGAIDCALAQREQRAVLTVRDSGLGIAGEDLERVFSRFGRLVTRDNSHIPGAGLGLFLARESARRMGGDITVASRQGKGSSFTLTLPLDGEASPGRARAPLR